MNYVIANMVYMQSSPCATHRLVLLILDELLDLFILNLRGCCFVNVRRVGFGLSIRSFF